MLPISEQSTRSTLHTRAAADDDFEADDDDLSEHDFTADHRSHHAKHEYVSTNLIVDMNITLADVIEEETSQAVITERLQMHQARVRFRSNPFGIIDPRAEYRVKKADHDLHTMVPEAEVAALGAKAEEVWLRYQEEFAKKHDAEHVPSMEKLGRFASRVLHDHLRAAPGPGSGGHL